MLIFEKSKKGRHLSLLPPLDVPAVELSGGNQKRAGTTPSRGIGK